MKPVLLAIAAAVLTLNGTAAAYADTSTGAGAVEITQDSTNVSTSIGMHFSFTSTVQNTSDQPVTGLVAHLNVVSLDSNVYVDPEDWSSKRTQYLPEIPAKSSTPQSWSVQAVNDGTFVIYVAVTTAAGGSPVVGGPALHVDVAAQRSINAGGILPIAAAVPVVLLGLLVTTRVRRRRLT
ncbi:MAG: hypothetical protein QOG53_2157 [Frankiales bacterium]|jgi:hypothetical protein|nr:hypothetical protein [Frankiales bacterium]